MEVGIITAIIVGGIAGWVAEKVMKSDMGLLANIALGIVGALVASFLLGLIGVNFGGVLGYFIAAVIGACLLIFIARKIRR
jgi:uncharacterized membrane protein YeaQ/YmgE (transglycosylase-associated protein family)